MSASVTRACDRCRQQVPASRDETRRRDRRDMWDRWATEQAEKRDSGSTVAVSRHVTFQLRVRSDE